jgi:selenocysteine lyase/cysteine desulfurase
VSPHFYNTNEHIDRFADALRAVLAAGDERARRDPG